MSPQPRLSVLKRSLKLPLFFSAYLDATASALPFVSIHHIPTEPDPPVPHRKLAVAATAETATVRANGFNALTQCNSKARLH